MTACRMDATALAALLRRGETSAVSLLEERIADIEARDPALNSIVLKDYDRAREAARLADTRLANGRLDFGEQAPLLGVPITIKESFDVAGLPTSWGMEPFRNTRASADAEVVARLRRAGAIILGKTNVSEALAGWRSDNPVHGRTSHPLSPELTPGGSSGGAAVCVAAGLVPFALGSDLGGSTRVPAHFCGIFGHDPSAGLVPARGHALGGLMAPLDGSSPGPMAMSARDLAVGLDAIAGPGELEATGYRLALPPSRHDTLRRFRVLTLDTHPLMPTDPEVRGAVEICADHLRRAGASVRTAVGIIPDIAESTRQFVTLVGSALSLAISDDEWGRLRAATARWPAADRSLAALGERASLLSHRDWLAANEARARLRHAWKAVFEQYDVVICPPSCTPAVTHEVAASPMIVVDGVEMARDGLIGWSAISKIARLPATVMPMARTSDGRPLGVQIIGPYLEDHTTIALARMLSS